jgi:amino acid adenylation domain-containing protein
MLNEAERRRLLIEWNETRTDYPRDESIVGVFEDAAARFSDRVAVRFGSQILTYRELNERANQLSWYLNDIGVTSNCVVGLCVERSLEMVVGLLGILKSGAAYLPLDIDYPKDRLAFMLSDTEARVTIAHRATAERVASLSGGTQVVCLDAMEPAIGSQTKEKPARRSTAADLAYVMYTSGSTGRPKGVMAGHRAIVRLVKNTNYCNFGPGEIFLQLAPISFDASTFEIWGPLLNGGELALMSPRTPSLSEIGRAIREYGVTTLWLTAGLFHVMADQRVHDLSTLRQLLVGGDVVSAAHVRKALEVMREGRIVNGYGPTEGTTFSCCFPMTAACPPADTTPIGRPISNTTAYVLNGSLEHAGVGETGELYIGGDGLAFGYLNDPELTSQRFVSNPFSAEPGARLYRTGDLVRRRPDDQLDFVGRADRQIKLAGHRIDPAEIEAVLNRHPAVRQAVVTALADEESGKRLVAYVTAKKNDPELAAELRQYLMATLPGYMAPSAILQLEELPLSPNGKIERSALPAPQSSTSRSELAAHGALAEIQEQIAQIWRKVLRIDRLGQDENFFDAGGDSLNLIEAHSELEKIFGGGLSITDLFEHTTVRALAVHLAKAPAQKEGPALSEERGARKRQALAEREQRRAARCL